MHQRERGAGGEEKQASTQARRCIFMHPCLKCQDFLTLSDCGADTSPRFNKKTHSLIISTVVRTESETRNEGGRKTAQTCSALGRFRYKFFPPFLVVFPIVLAGVPQAADEPAIQTSHQPYNSPSP